MRVAICGASGFLGTHISRSLVASGYEVVRIGREHFKNSNDLSSSLDGCEAIINVCGAPIVGKWNEVYKHELYVSRIETTKKLFKATDQLLFEKPKLFLSISSVGIYKHGLEHDEDSTQYDTSYLALLAKEWEAEAFKAEEFGLRPVVLRLGAVIGKGGGILDEVKYAFRLGFGLLPGDGKQAFPWVHIDDVVKVCKQALKDEKMEGVYNVVSPKATDMKSFFKSVGKSLRRPAVLRAPKWLMKWRYAEGAQNILKGTAVSAKRLDNEGYKFEYKDLDKALESVFQ